MQNGAGDNWDRIQEIFLEALDLREGEQNGYLDSACGADAVVRAEVESLLRAAPGDDWLTNAVGSQAVALLRGSPLTGTRLGAYRVIREICHDGMGAVYLAERADDQYHEQVAIKVVKLGLDTVEVLSRFRHERQILAGLEHPYIARLLDGGTSPDGRPYFVMEHVEGLAINIYCREFNLGLESRLRLFQRVCEAVSYAHQRLAVHGDLKPDNILVTAAGIPKLLDFGAFTSGPILTEYASPEQVRGLPVTAAADIYALGALLHELVTGLKASASHPSLAGLCWRLDQDLDRIVLTAMSNEPDRRYLSADSLCEDIDRRFAGLPVLAR